MSDGIIPGCLNGLGLVTLNEGVPQLYNFFAPFLWLYQYGDCAGVIVHHSETILLFRLSWHRKDHSLPFVHPRHAAARSRPPALTNQYHYMLRVLTLSGYWFQAFTHVWATIVCTLPPKNH